VVDAERRVAERLQELRPLAGALASEAREIGQSLPPGIAAVVSILAGGTVEAVSDGPSLLQSMEQVRAAIFGQRSALRTLVERVLRLAARAEARDPEILNRAQDMLWWRIWTLDGSPEELDLLAEPMGFAQGARIAAARDKDFAARLEAELDQGRPVLEVAPTRRGAS
jgi:hypothetical protein